MGSSASSCPHTVEGELAFDYPPAGKPLKTWYKVTGDITPTSIPLFILHGGPGAGAEAYNILQEKKGAGPEFWKDAIFVLELHNLIRHFGLDSDGRQYDVIGHSWGGMFGTVFAGGRPKGLRRYIVWSAAPSLQLWNSAQKGLLKTMPEEIQDTIERCKREGTTDSQEYKDAINEIYKRFLCRIDPVPDDIMDGLKEIEKDSTYVPADSPGESWSAIDCIPVIDVPVLLINGRYDQAQDSCLLAFFQRLKRASWVQFSDSSHMAHYEERERFMEVVGEFLTQTEG